MPETIGELQTGYLDSISNIDTNKSIIKLIISTGGWLKLPSKFQDGESDGNEASCYTVQ